jgi:site-specific DNA recombinase
MNLSVSIASRAALYLRVSTMRQAEVDLSIPDQRLQTMAYCERRGWQVVADWSSRAPLRWTINALNSSV